MNERRNSISRRLTFMNMVVSGMALLIACLAFLAYDLVSFRYSLLRNLNIQAQIISSNSVSALTFNDPQSAQNTLRALAASSNIVSAGIFTPDGRTFAQYGRTARDQLTRLPVLPADGVDAHEFNMNQVVLVHPIVFQGKNLGTIYIRSDLQRFYNRVWQYLKILALVLLASMLAALAVSKLFGRAVARPLMNLAELARIVSRDKNYAVRAPETDTGGEIEVLITAFNKMLQEIQLRDRELRVARTGLEKRVDERTRQLVATNRELEAFSYSVSHDLRNPLEAINGFSYLLRKGYGDKLDAEGKEYLQEISAATMRMAELIDDLLSFSQASTAEMSRENVDLSALVTNITAELRRRDPVRSVDFVIAENVTAEGDSRLLRIVLDNLLSNAWKYTSGREKARVEFGRMQENGATIYYVSDNGVGFNPQSKDRLFKPFQRLHSKAEFPGTGVGLATVRRIINRHGGQIWAEATLEKGATFYFMLDSEIPVLKRA